MTHVVRQTYTWLSTAFGNVPTLDDNMMIDKMKLIGKLLIEEIEEYEEAQTRDEKINAISDLLFVVNKMPFFLGYTADKAVELFDNVNVNYPRRYNSNQFIEGIKDIFLNDNYVLMNKSVALLDYADVVYSIKNMIIFSGFTDYEMFIENERVFNSNMTKFCKTLEEAKRSVAMYENGTHPNKYGQKIETIYMETGHAEYPYRIQTPEGKIMKSHSFLDVEHF